MVFSDTLTRDIEQKARNIHANEKYNRDGNNITNQKEKEELTDGSGKSTSLYLGDLKLGSDKIHTQAFAESL